MNEMKNLDGTDFFAEKIDGKLGEELLNSEGKSIIKNNGTDENTSRYDLFSLPEMSLSQIKNVIKNILGIEQLGKKEYEKINNLLNNSREYLKGFLMYDSIPKSIFDIEIKDKKSLEDFISLAYGNNKDSHSGPVICAILKIMDGFNHIEKSSFDSFEGETIFFKNKVTDDFYKKGNSYIFEKNNGEDIKFKILSRGKSFERILLKCGKKAEYNIENIITDGMGMEFEFSSKEELDTVFSYIIEKLQRSKLISLKGGNTDGELEISDKNFFENEKEMNDFIQNNLEGINSSIKPNKNLNSDKSYSALHLIGKAKVPNKGKRGNIITKKPFEVKFVIFNKEGEGKFEHHSIYEAKQMLSFITRLFGYFSEEYLEKIVQKASEKSGVSREDIIEHFNKKDIKSFKFPKSKKDRFMSIDQIEHFKGTPLIGKNIDSIISETGNKLKKVA